MHQASVARKFLQAWRIAPVMSHAASATADKLFRYASSSCLLDVQHVVWAHCTLGEHGLLHRLSNVAKEHSLCCMTLSLPPQACPGLSFQLRNC